MKDLNKLLQEAKDDLASLGIQYGNVQCIYVNNRLTVTWGRCTKRFYDYKIEINPQLALDTTSDQAALDTIMHELIHTCRGCMNHGSHFKRIGDLVSIYGYTIQRCTSAAEKGLTSRKEDSAYYKYHVTCTQCGQVNKYARATKLIGYIQKKDHRQFYYSCRICGNNKFKLTYV